MEKRGGKETDLEIDDGSSKSEYFFLSCSDAPRMISHRYIGATTASCIIKNLFEHLQARKPSGSMRGSTNLLHTEARKTRHPSPQCLVRRESV